MNFKIKTYVYATDKYELFKIIEGNRKVLENRVDKIKNSIKKGYVINPIIVNENMEIIDGQGRYFALRELGMEIDFIIAKGAGIEECRRLNETSTNWNTLDFVYSHASAGNENYRKLLLLRELYPYIVSIETLCFMVQGSKNNKNGKILEFVRSGNFIVSDTGYHNAEIIAQKIGDFEKFGDYFQQNIFQRAFMTILSTGKYDHKRMMAKMEQCSGKFVKQSSISDYLKQFTEVYNFRARKNDFVNFEYENKKAPLLY